MNLLLPVLIVQLFVTVESDVPFYSVMSGHCWCAVLYCRRGRGDENSV